MSDSWKGLINCTIAKTVKENTNVDFSLLVNEKRKGDDIKYFASSGRRGPKEKERYNHAEPD